MGQRGKRRKVMASQIKQCLTVFVPIVITIMEGERVAFAKAVNAALKKNGVPDGTPIQVDVVPRKYDFEVTATWSQQDADALATRERKEKENEQ
jgi:hypothetical protein